ncbi:MAG: MBL fold metallo-hydrolase [Planctomycetales bacterium]|nr:MBL fold metallo-hydrolase [Planctomycetales bacterium]
MQLAPGVYRFDTGPFNWYLVEERGRLTLIDAGFPGHYATLLKGLATLGKSPSDIEAVLLTHAHADHTGFAARLRKEFKIPVFIHRDDVSALTRRLNLPWYGLLSNAWRPFVRRLLWHATWHGVFRMSTTPDAFPLVDGQELDFPGRPRVIHVPGHTAGETVFHLPERGVLFSGDAIVTRDLMSGGNGGPQLAHRLLNSDHRQAQVAAARLRELGRATLMPGHGEPWTGEMQEALELAAVQ